MEPNWRIPFFRKNWASLPLLLFTGGACWLEFGPAVLAALLAGGVAIGVTGTLWARHRARNPRTRYGYLVAYAELRNAVFRSAVAFNSDPVPDRPTTYPGGDPAALAEQLERAARFVSRTTPPDTVSADITELLTVVQAAAGDIRALTPSATAGPDRGVWRSARPVRERLSRAATLIGSIDGRQRMAVVRALEAT